MEFNNGASKNYVTDATDETVRAEVQKSKILTTSHFAKTIPQFDPTTLPKNAFIYVVAPRRSGKTTLVEDMIDKVRRSSKIDLCLLYSKSNAGFANIPQRFRFRDMTSIQSLIDTQIKVKQANRKRQRKIKSNVIVILDDQIDGSSTEMRKSDLIIKLASMGRHISDGEHSNIQFWCLSQQITAVPPVVRRNFDYVISFKVPSRLQRRMIVEEWLTLKSGRAGMKEAYDLFDIVNAKDFNAIVIHATHSNKYSYSDYVSQYKATPLKKTREPWSGTARDMEVPFSIYF